MINRKLAKNRITEHLEKLKSNNRKALTIFLTAAYPTLDSTVPLALLCASAEVDILEIGMPFSDPLADGPVIQNSSQQALKNGVTLHIIFHQIKQIRKQSEIPIVLMGYLNPVLRYGVEKFFHDAYSAGVDGLILPEVPLEESSQYRALADKYSIALIQLVTPTTPSGRVTLLDQATRGFLYCVSATGVTGHTGSESVIRKHVERIKTLAKNPILVGFGIQSPQQAAMVARYADGVIIGSAFIKRLNESRDKKDLSVLYNWLQSFKNVL